ncbi:MAG: hypothetical protein R3B06_04730 [Kofleriaceae bacterium]
MSTKTAVNAIACAPGTLPGGPVRTRFFDGMFLTQADLENEQRYWRLKRRLTNRALGDGVVWGLRLGWDAKSRTFALSPGYALDCCGNDLVVECPVQLTERELWTRADPALRPAAGASFSNAAGANHDEAHRHACVVLQYTECPEDARPVHRDACAGPTGTCETSRIRESARLVLVPPPARPPLTPPELFLKELEELRGSITDPAVRDLLFPPQPTAPAVPTGDLPLTVRATVPGTPAATRELVFPASGSRTGAPFAADQLPTAARRTGVVTFQLAPGAGWQLVGGQVTDQGRVVEAVTPPAAPSMFWSLDVALPDGVQTTSVHFEFVVDDLELGPTMGTTATARVRARISGNAVVQTSAVTQALHVEVNELNVTVEEATGFDLATPAGCLRELVPWGWTVDPANGGRVARTLVLSGIYGALAELTTRNGQYQTVASYLYAIAWYALFGVNATAAVPAALKAQLTRLIVKLYERWCNGLAYPGPRCADEHHGVYLGCVELDRRGAVVGFDMREHRRYVLTGPVVNHWLGQFGIAPVDVVVGRFAQALCCLSGLGPITLPTRGDDLQPGLGTATDSFHVGTVASVGTFAQAHRTTAAWVPLEVLAASFPTAMRAARSPTATYRVLAAAIDGGGRIAIAVPDASPSPVGGHRVSSDVVDLLRRGPVRARALGREAVADFTERVFTTAPVTAILGPDATPAMRKLAEAASAGGAHLADAAQGGTKALLAFARVEPALQAAAPELVDLAEWAVEHLATTTVEKFGAQLDRAVFGKPEVQRTLVELAAKVIPKIEPALVIAAARATAAG